VVSHSLSVFRIVSFGKVGTQLLHSANNVQGFWLGVTTAEVGGADATAAFDAAEFVQDADADTDTEPLKPDPTQDPVFLELEPTTAEPEPETEPETETEPEPELDLEIGIDAGTNARASARKHPPPELFEALLVRKTAARAARRLLPCGKAIPFEDISFVKV
jgi:hypothetical protein